MREAPEQRIFEEFKTAKKPEKKGAFGLFGEKGLRLSKEEKREVKSLQKKREELKEKIKKARDPQEKLFLQRQLRDINQDFLGILIGPFEREKFREAREILDKDFLGPEEFKKVFGIILTPEQREKIDYIPFTREEIEKAKELGMMLVLRVSQDSEGRPLTMARMQEIFSKMMGHSPFDFDVENLQNQDFFKESIPDFGWALVGKELIPASSNKTFSEQEEILKEWAITHGLDPKTVRRRTAVEQEYDSLLYYLNNLEEILWDDLDVSSSRHNEGFIVEIGRFRGGQLGISFLPGPDAFPGKTNSGVCPSIPRKPIEPETFCSKQ